MANPKPLTLLSQRELSQSAVNPTVKGKFATMRWKIERNNPVLEVNTNDPAKMNKEGGFGKIKVSLNLFTAGLICETLIVAANSKEPYRRIIQCFNHEWVNNQRNQDRTHLHDIVINRADDGVVTMAVIAKTGNWPTIKFPIVLPDMRYQKFCKGDGTAVDMSELTQSCARVYGKVMLPVIQQLMVRDYEPPAPPANRGGQGGGGGGGYGQRQSYGQRDQGGGGYGGGGGRSQTVVSDSDGDDDIPY